MKLNLEVTDTFGGEANYCWVRRETITLPDDTTDLRIVRKLKEFAGFTGMRCRSESYGDTYQVTPIGRHALLQTAFATIEW